MSKRYSWRNLLGFTLVSGILSASLTYSIPATAGPHGIACAYTGGDGHRGRLLTLCLFGEEKFMQFLCYQCWRKIKFFSLRASIVQKLQRAILPHRQN